MQNNENIHYKKLKIEPINFITSNNLNFAEGNVVKYITRYKHKHKDTIKQIEDLEKAATYIGYLIKELRIKL